MHGWNTTPFLFQQQRSNQPPRKQNPIWKWFIKHPNRKQWDPVGTAIKCNFLLTKISTWMAKRSYSRKGGGQVFNPCSTILFFPPYLISPDRLSSLWAVFQPCNLLAGHLTLVSPKQKEWLHRSLGPNPCSTSNPMASFPAIYQATAAHIVGNGSDLWKGSILFNLF